MRPVGRCQGCHALLAEREAGLCCRAGGTMTGVLSAANEMVRLSLPVPGQLARPVGSNHWLIGDHDLRLV